MDDSKKGPRETVYDEHIAPLMGQIIELCKEHGIPLVALFELDYDEQKGSPMLCTTELPFEGCCERIRELARIARPRPALLMAFTVRNDGKAN